MSAVVVFNVGGTIDKVVSGIGERTAASVLPTVVERTVKSYSRQSRIVCLVAALCLEGLQIH